MNKKRKSNNSLFFLQPRVHRASKSCQCENFSWVSGHWNLLNKALVLSYSSLKHYQMLIEDRRNPSEWFWPRNARVASWPAYLRTGSIPEFYHKSDKKRRGRFENFMNNLRPPGCSDMNFVISSTSFPRIIQQSSLVLCFDTSSSVKKLSSDIKDTLFSYQNFWFIFQ